MAAEGWHPDPTANLESGDGVVGLFRYPLNEDFATRAGFAWLGDLPPLQVDTGIGVSYERSFRVWPYLTGYPRCELRFGVVEGALVAPLVELWELEEVDRAVDEIVTPVLEGAIAWAEPYGLFEAFLAALENSSEAVVELQDLPVVLAAAGMPLDARRTMTSARAKYANTDDDLLMDDFSARFERWLASGAPQVPFGEPDPPFPVWTEPEWW
jgi:hypothetical protein